MDTTTDARRVRFAAFEADLRTGELFKHGVRIKIQDQPFEVLAMLLRRPGELVSREELHRKLWANDTFVDFDAGLNAAVRRLRDALNDSAERPRYIETVPRRGYRFVAVVEAVEVVEASQPEGKVASTQISAVVPMESKATFHTAPGSRGEPRLNWLWAVTIAGGIVLFVTFNMSAWRSRFFSTHAAVGIRSIAVLPLQNLTGDPQRGFFVDGMTETLVTELAQIRSLRVTSRLSPSQLKQTKLSVREIGTQLNVDAVLEGSVLQSGPRVRIAVRLIEASSERCRWAKEYDRDEHDILNLQSEIAKTVAAEIPVQLGPTEEGRLRQDRSVNPEAYENYLEGQYLWRKRTVKSLYGSIEYFQQAVRLDPGWGRGYAGLAEAYAILGYGVMVELPPDEAATKARAFAIEAAALDPTLAAPHAVLGLIKHRHDWDWSGADEEFRRAIELDPSYATGYYWYSNYFQTLDRRENERLELETARHLDPTYPAVFTGVAGNLDRSGHHEEAVSVWKQAIRLEGENWGAHYDLARSYEGVGQYDDAIREYSRVLEFSDGNVRVKGGIARVYALAGRNAEARALLREIDGKTNSAFSMAEVYVALGEKERALNYLRQAMKERCGWVVYMRVLPSLDPLRSDKHFQEMIEQIKFPADGEPRREQR